LTRGEIVGAPHARGDKAFVVTQIQIGFCAIFGDKNFTVLKGRHRAGVNIDVGIELD
jgi:hypothetical protein